LINCFSPPMFVSSSSQTGMELIAKCVVVLLLGQIQCQPIAKVPTTLSEKELNMLHADAVMAGSAGKDNLWFEAIDAKLLDRVITEMNAMNKWFARVVKYWDEFTSGRDGASVYMEGKNEDSEMSGPEDGEAEDGEAEQDEGAGARADEGEGEAGEGAGEEDGVAEDGEGEEDGGAKEVADEEGEGAGDEGEGAEEEGEGGEEEGEGGEEEGEGAGEEGEGAEEEGEGAGEEGEGTEQEGEGAEEEGEGAGEEGEGAPEEVEAEEEGEGEEATKGGEEEEGEVAEGEEAEADLPPEEVEARMRMMKRMRRM